MSTSKVLNTNEILLGNPNTQEREATAEIVPGMVCYERAGELDPAPAGRWDGAIALSKDEQGQGYSGVYATDSASTNVYDAGDEARYAIVDTGDDFHAWALAEGSDITEGDLLEISATDGILQKYSSGTPIAVAMESIAMSGIVVNTPIACRRTVVYTAPVSAPAQYVAKISQSGTGDPTAVVFENTLSGTPVWSRQGSGSYRLTLADEFPTAKTVVEFTPFQGGGNAQNFMDMTESTSNDDYIAFQTLVDGGIPSATDSVFNGYLRVSVYP